VTEGPRPRKYYTITDYGREIREKLLGSLRSISVAVGKLENEMRGVH